MKTGFCFLIALSYFLSLSAQKIEYQFPTTREVVVYNNDCKIVAHVLLNAPEKKIKIIPTLYYKWFKEDIILQTKGGYKGNLLHGAFQESYPNKQLKQKGNFVNGLKDGIWMSWYENGEIQEIAPWKEGVIEGENKIFNNKGELIQLSYYNNGLLNGWKLEYSGGKEISRKKFKNGAEVNQKETIRMEQNKGADGKEEKLKKGKKERKNQGKKNSDKKKIDQDPAPEPQKKETKIKA